MVKLCMNTIFVIPEIKALSYLRYSPFKIGSMEELFTFYSSPAW
jgi:hypothetical protein